MSARISAAQFPRMVEAQIAILKRSRSNVARFPNWRSHGRAGYKDGTGEIKSAPKLKLKTNRPSSSLNSAHNHHRIVDGSMRTPSAKAKSKSERRQFHVRRRFRDSLIKAPSGVSAERVGRWLFMRSRLRSHHREPASLSSKTSPASEMTVSDVLRANTEQLVERSSARVELGKEALRTNCICRTLGPIFYRGTNLQKI